MTSIVARLSKPLACVTFDRRRECSSAGRTKSRKSDADPATEGDRTFVSAAMPDLRSAAIRPTLSLDLIGIQIA